MRKLPMPTPLPSHPFNGGRKRKYLLRLGHVDIALSCLFVITVSAYYHYWSRWKLQQSDSTRRFSGQQQDPVNQNNHLVDPKIVYVHVGKTGGEWIKSQLPVICKTRRNSKLKQNCLQRFATSATPNAITDTTPALSLLQNAVIGYIHTTLIYPKNIQYSLAITHYLFSIRHPYERFQSWYIYNHPKSCDPREYNSPSCKTKNAIIEGLSSSTAIKSSSWNKLFFHDCFPTFYDLMDYNSNKKIVSKVGQVRDSVAGNNDVSSTTVSCSTVLWNGIKGDTTDNIVSSAKEPNHLYWNYQVRKKINKCKSLSVEPSSFKLSCLLSLVTSHSLSVALSPPVRLPVLLESNSGQSQQ